MARMIPAHRRTLYYLYMIVCSQVTIFLPKRLIFFTARYSFQQRRCLQTLYRPLPEFHIEGSPAHREHSDVSWSYMCIDELRPLRSPIIGRGGGSYELLNQKKNGRCGSALTTHTTPETHSQDQWREKSRYRCEKGCYFNCYWCCDSRKLENSSAVAQMIFSNVFQHS